MCPLEAHVHWAARVESGVMAGLLFARALLSDSAGDMQRADRLQHRSVGLGSVEALHVGNHVTGLLKRSMCMLQASIP